MARTTQRDVMRNFNRRFNGDHDKDVAAYAAAERRGEVTRASNVLDMGGVYNGSPSIYDWFARSQSL